jgi:ABC-2 type transport system permease protein/oleandomycin transport system permease protein
MFLLLFNYVFGGAISLGNVGNEKYIFFLLPGILVQTVLFGSIQTGVGLAEDLQKGIVDRLRSLPMARSAVVAGRIIADAIRNILVVGLMLIVGLIIGFRFENGFWPAVAGFILMLLFGVAFSWLSANIGIFSKDSETAQVMGFVWVFPLAFASAIFVPVETMPGWLQGFVRNQPITHAAKAVRYLFLGQGDISSVWKTLAWIVGLIMIFFPLAVRAYRSSNNDK